MKLFSVSLLGVELWGHLIEGMLLGLELDTENRWMSINLLIIKITIIQQRKTIIDEFCD